MGRSMGMSMSAQKRQRNQQNQRRALPVTIAAWHGDGGDHTSAGICHALDPDSSIRTIIAGHMNPLSLPSSPPEVGPETRAIRYRRGEIGAAAAIAAQLPSR